MKKKRLGEVLRERGHISSDDLAKAIEDQQGKLVHLGELMLERGLVTKQDLASALTEITRVPYMDCATLQLDPETLKLVPHALAKRCCAMPVQAQGTTKLIMVIAEPQNLQVVDELRFSIGMEIVPRLGFRDEIESAIEKWYGNAEQAAAAVAEAIASTEDPGMEFVSSSSLQRNIDAMQEMQAELQQKSTPAVRLAASIITAAANKSASDIHIEPQVADTAVRFRIDGLLRDQQRIPRTLQNSVISRLKILSDMDIAERRAPQDGRFLVKLAGRRIDLRVSTLPTQYGEKVVMRLLEADAPLRDFASLGFPPNVAEGLERILRMPQGMLLVTGPTGSGKSTTLYSSLNLVRRPSINIVTVEDPVEYVIPGLNQVQVNSKAGLTFGSCLRSVLRQDPNVIMIGEIRDKETAEIAMKAAQTGHLVLSTLHTNDSISTITRLLDLGVPAFQIATSLTGVISQRLIRRLCACHRLAPAKPEFVSRLRVAGIDDPPSMESIPGGCEVCDSTGYKGRVGIYEFLELNDAMRAAIRSTSGTEAIRALARQNGMKSMQDYALERVRDGGTTVEEVLRVIPFEAAAAVHCPDCGGDTLPGFLFCPYCGTSLSDPPRKQSKKHSLVEQGAGRA